MKKENILFTVLGLTIMCSLIILFGFTPLGNFHISGFNLTLIGLPVAIIACVYGPYAGAGAGLLWGVVSSFQGFLGLDQAGGEFFAVSPLGCILTCVIARVIAGFVCGLIFDLVRIYDETGVGSSFAGCAVLPLINGALFITLYSIVCTIVGASAESISVTTNVLDVMFSSDTINLLVELAINVILGAPLTIAMYKISTIYAVDPITPHLFLGRRKKETASDFTE